VDENRSPLRIRYFRTIVNDGSSVCLPGQKDAEALRLDSKGSSWPKNPTRGVVGDVNSTMGCAFGYLQDLIRFLRFPAYGSRTWKQDYGLSTDRMPEEINRIDTDHVSDLLFVTEEKWDSEPSIKKGFRSNAVHLVGNTMIDPSSLSKTGLRNRRSAKNWG